jgi:hypothetical protein
MKINTRGGLILCFGFLLEIIFSVSASAQGDVRWLRVSKLHSFYQDYGSEMETDANTYMAALSWPADYGLNPYTLRAKGLWIGCQNFKDPVTKVTYPYKVVTIGPRGASNDTYFSGKMFIQKLQLIGRYDHPLVYVDQQSASINGTYDALDALDPNLVSDRAIVNMINTQMGITMTRKIMAFTNQYYDNFFVYDYVFKNTGIVDASGSVVTQNLDSCVFLFPFRYSLAGEARPNSDASPVYPDGWAPQATRWGLNTLVQVVGTDPSKANFKYRAHYAFYGPHGSHAVTDDWGCPNEHDVTGVLAAARYVGCVTLHADKSARDASDDLNQPKTTAILQADAQLTQGGTISPYDAAQMALHYQFMTKGHDAVTNADGFKASGQQYANVYENSLPDGTGGPCATQGFGPYNLAPGDSIHIVVAEGVAGLSRQKNREVQTNWYDWFNQVSTPALVTPSGNDTSKSSVARPYDAYKNAWVFTCEDSIKQTLQRAVDLYKANYKVPQPPPAPSVFNVNSGGDRIALSWGNNARSWPNFNGYVIYRSTGNFYAANTVYEKIWECSKLNAVETFDDITARRGFDYYYYIQSKDDGSTNIIQPGVPLVSSMFLTQTSKPAHLLRPAKTGLDSIRVVPNPYVIQARKLQFADPLTGFDRDRIAFFGLPGKCTIRLFTERGDLVWQKDHTDGSADEYWNSQTMYGQVVVSGVYLAHFETPDGKSIIRKFIVIR